MAAPSAPFTINEQERLDTLYSYQVLDTAPENSFGNIIQLVTRIFNVPIAFISFIAGERIWFKSSHGIPVPEILRAAGLCGHTILSNDVFIVTDALEDEVAKENMLVTGPMGLCGGPPRRRRRRMKGPWAPPLPGRPRLAMRISRW